MSSAARSGDQRADRFNFPSFDIRVETVPVPQLIHPDDEIVQVTLVWNDLHVYVGHNTARAEIYTILPAGVIS
ncbi:hypothetical protein QCA50_013689 [Cerrena zonata]|uniref:Uncharacterized protein n=1 Tax=Cerrena zonata TaxID=2478898 RepID=A0AAW0FSE8_9APHY